MSTRSHLASSAGKFETQAQILAMRTQVCWRPNTTILRSLFFLHTHVIPKKRKKTSHCSMGTRSHLASSAGKFETLGSNFSQETPQVATGVLILQSLEVFFSYVLMSFQRIEKKTSQL